MPRRVLLIAATTGYQVREFAAAAENLGLDLVLATDRCHVLDNPWGDDALPLRFDDPSPGFDALAARGPFAGIVAVGDRPAFVAAQAAERLGLPFSPPDAVLAAGNKFLSRERFRAAGLPVPHHRLIPLDSDPREAALTTSFPCVLKPLVLSGSRGVIRANNALEFAGAFTRIKKILAAEKQAAPQPAASQQGISQHTTLQVEDFIPGREYALEGLVTRGQLQELALFDKPDPLDGPFFEESIYLTPSREPAAVQQSIFEMVQRAVSALGLTQGPVHAEARVNSNGVWMLEAAARPIGGLCSRVLRFEPSITLEEVILRHAVGEDMSGLRPASGARGVMMIPIPRAGVYAGVAGADIAREVAGIEDVVITAKEGQTMLPLPEGASYLGFIFARGDSPGSVEHALRQSHSQLRFRLSDVLPVVK